MPKNTFILIAAAFVLLSASALVVYFCSPLAAWINKNDPPEIISTPIITVVQDQAYLYHVEINDPDAGDKLTYSLITSPDGMTVDENTGLIQWIPDSSLVGDHTVTVQVEDVRCLSDVESFVVTVVNVNDAPSIISAAETAAAEDELYAYDVEVIDPDIGDELTYSLVVSPDDMIIDGASGRIRWIPDNSYVGDHAVTVRVQDTEGLYDTQSFLITVANVNDAPEITSIAEIAATEDELYSYEVEVIDPDVGDWLTYSLTTYPEGMIIGEDTGLIEWTPDNSFVGDHAVTVCVRDGEGVQATQSYTVTVANVNDAPEITSIAETVATQDQIYSYDVGAVDPDVGDEVNYSLMTSPEGMNIDESTGLIQWTPDNSQVGDHAILVRVQDISGLHHDQDFTVSVANVNDAPGIVSVAETIATEDQTYSYNVEAIDPDVGDELTYSLITSPEGMSIDEMTGLVKWEPDDSLVGEHAVIVRVEDIDGLYDMQTYIVTVAPNVDKYAVIAGVSDYRIMNDLRYCDEDATSWYDYLTGEGYVCLVYGDTNAGNYPQYDGKAFEYNVRESIRSMVDLADSNDYVAFVFSGHGGEYGESGSHLCMWDAGAGEGDMDGYCRDTELAADFESCRAAQLFVFLDACHSGGMNEVVSNLSIGHVYMTTTCTSIGGGWDLRSRRHGAWTYYYLVWGLLSEEHSEWDMTICHDQAYDRYRAYYIGTLGGAGDWDARDHPMEFNSQPGTPFYL